MIVRRASEIIRLAATMAQINNTDALSWKDKTDMLNQSYIRLYSDLNNSGDLYYSKDMILDVIEVLNGNNQRFRLPKDFWKLLEIGYMSLGHFTPLLRAPNSGEFVGYKIINNELVMPSSFSNLAIKYIPCPQKITFPKLGYKLPGNFNQAAYDSFNNVIVLGSPGLLTVIDRSNNVTVSTKIVEVDSNNDEQNIPFVLAISAGIIYVVKETGIEYYDYSLAEPSIFEGTFNLYAHAIGWEDGIIVSQEGVIKKFIAGSEPTESDDYWNFIDGNIIKNGNVFTYSNENESRDISEIFMDADSFVIANPFIYINKKGSVNVYEEFEPTDFAPAIVGKGSRKGLVLAAEVNNDTGYGVILKDFYSGLEMTGFASDTVLNYPNNIFFDWLTADLAIKFKIALDIPTGELPSLAADYLDTLKANISRDAFRAQRINNAYGG